jgi:hypothetical protein
MLKLTYRVNGVETSSLPDLRNEIMRAVADAARKEITKHAQRVQCPVHGNGVKNAKILIQGSSATFEWDGCCETFDERMKAEMAQMST